jgi:transcription-repair coupling factor (superfamily II helicase)
MPRQPQMLETKFTDESPVTLEGLQTQLKAHKLAGQIKNQGDIARLQIALQPNQKPMVWLKQLTDFFTSLV